MAESATIEEPIVEEPQPVHFVEDDRQEQESRRREDQTREEQSRSWLEETYKRASEYLSSFFEPQQNNATEAIDSKAMESSIEPKGDPKTAARHEEILASLDANNEVVGWTQAHEDALNRQLEELEKEEAHQGKKPEEEAEGDDEKQGISNADRMAALRKQQEEQEAEQEEENKEPKELMREKTSTIVGHTDDGVPITVDVESKVTKEKDENGEDKLMVNSDVRSYQGDVMVSKTNAKTEIAMGEDVEVESADGEKMSGKLVAVNPETKKATIEFPGNDPIEIDLKAVTQGINEKLTKGANNDLKAHHEDETPEEQQEKASGGMKM